MGPNRAQERERAAAAGLDSVLDMVGRPNLISGCPNLNRCAQGGALRNALGSVWSA
jgi:hypothetical protein